MKMTYYFKADAKLWIIDALETIEDIPEMEQDAKKVAKYLKRVENRHNVSIPDNITEHYDVYDVIWEALDQFNAYSEDKIITDYGYPIEQIRVETEYDRKRAVFKAIKEYTDTRDEWARDYERMRG